MLSVETFNTALDTISSFWARRKSVPRSVELQYLGGELLTVPSGHLEALVAHGRQFFSALGVSVRDGAQSNLVGSASRVAHLRKLFGDRIGSSIDHFSGKRTVGGSGAGYEKVFVVRQQELAQRGFRVPMIFTIDADTVQYVEREARIADNEGYDLTFRPVLPSRHNDNDIRVVESDVLGRYYLPAFQSWLLQGRVVINPFYDLVVRRMTELGYMDGDLVEGFGCHFRTDCASGSVHIEPDGHLYQCVEMCDQGHGLLGSPHGHGIDETMWRDLLRRGGAIARECGACEYYASCRGGCMADSLAHGGGTGERSPYCEVWKALFGQIDSAVSIHGPGHLRVWLHTLRKSVTYAATA